MDIRIQPTRSEVAVLAADFVEHALAEPAPTIGLATGGTPLATYAELIRRHREQGLRLGHAQYVLLDEYVGVGPDDPASYRRFIREQFTDPADIPASSVHGPAGESLDLARVGADYEQLLASLAPRVVQILGIGRDGHIGFNEPVSSLASRTRVKTLHPRTRRDNQRFFPEGEEVPTEAITMGIGTILEARRLVLLATGPAKADVIAAAVEGPVTSSVPASALQLHPSAVVIVDEAAASGLRERDYYREVSAHRPDWQRP